MKIIDKNNFFSVLGITYMCFIVGSTLIESILEGSLSSEHFNNLMSLAFCTLSIIILSQHYRLDNFSPLVIIIGQYVVALILAFLITWLTGFITPITEGGYRDILVSFTIPYILGALFYYRSLRLEIKKQNEDLKLIKALKNKS